MKKIFIFTLLFLSFGIYNVNADIVEDLPKDTWQINQEVDGNISNGKNNVKSNISSDATRNVGNTDIRDALIDTTENDIVNFSGNDGFSITAGILNWFKTELLSLVGVLAIGVFIFIGFRLFASRGNPEEFKNSLMHFVYAVIGIFVIFISWGAVKLVSTLSL